MLEGEFDALFADVVVKEASDLRFAEALRAHIQSLADASGRGINGSRVEEETGAGTAVIPDSQSGIEMANFDYRVRVESGIDGTEAQDLGIGAAGGGWWRLRIHRGGHGSDGDNNRSTALVRMGCGGRRGCSGSESSPGHGAIRRPGPTTPAAGERRRWGAIGCGGRWSRDSGWRSRCGFRAADVAEEFALGDVTHEADMRVRRVDETRSVLDAEVAAVPGAAQQRGELPSLTGQEREDGGELL